MSAAEGAGLLAQLSITPERRRSLSGASQYGVDVAAGWESVHGHLVLVSILTAASLFNV